MFQTIQRLPRLCPRSNIARMLVLQSNRQTMRRSFFRQIREVPHYALKTRFRLRRSPEREYPNYLRPKFLSNEERALRQPRLVVKCVLRGEDIVLKPDVNRRRIRQQT